MVRERFHLGFMHRDFSKKTYMTTLDNTINLVQWWEGLSPAWQETLLINLAFSEKQTKDKLRTTQAIRRYYYAPPGRMYQYFIGNPFDMSEHVISEDLLGHILDLEEILCQYTQISDLAPLKMLQKLSFLFCHSTKIQSLEAVRQLPNLRTLNCAKNNIRDLSGVGGFQALQTIIVQIRKLLS